MGYPIYVQFPFITLKFILLQISEKVWLYYDLNDFTNMSQLMYRRQN